MNKLIATLLLSISAATTAHATVIGYVNLYDQYGHYNGSQQQFSDVPCSKLPTYDTPIMNYLRSRPGYIMWETTAQGKTYMAGCYQVHSHGVVVDWQDQSTNVYPGVNWLN